MDMFNLISYINKVSLLVFFVTTLMVSYQIYVLKKEKTKKQIPFIPDFKDKIKSNEVINYTRLPNFLIKKDNKSTNYSKLVFLIISLLTIMVVVFVFILIKQNNSLHNRVSANPTIVILPTPTLKSTCKGQACLTPTITPTIKLIIISPSPTVSSSPTLTVSLSPSPTEIILAQTLSLTPTKSLDNISPTQGEFVNNKPQTLPETGSIRKGLFIIGVAILTIFFSFWF